MNSKGLKRLLIFVVFLIPVCWYSFLQLFGSNQFSVEVMTELSEECDFFQGINIVHRTDSLTSSRINSLNRVIYKSTAKEISHVPDTLGFFRCIQAQADLALVSEQGLWGTYELNREGVDRLLTELDILILQSSYGKGLSR